jgi:O-antigen/teichoic acid export membrane protein
MIRIFLTLGAIQVAVMAVQLVKTKALALLLGPDLVGIMAVVDRLIAVAAQTFTLSLPFAAAVYLPALWVRDRSGFLSLLARMRNTLAGATVLAGVGGAVVTLVRPGAWGEGLEPYRWVVFFGFLGLPALAFAPFLQNVLAGRLQERSALGFTLINAAVVTVSAVGGVLGWGLAGYYGVFAVAGTALVALAMRHIWRSSTTASPVEEGHSHAAAGQVMRDFSGGKWLPPIVWRFSLLLLALTFVMPFAALFVHYSVLVGLSPTAAGWMASAVGISLAVRGVLGAANSVFLTPNVNRGGSPERSLAWANAYGRTMILMATLLTPPLLLWPDVVVRVLYSSAFLPASDYVAVFVIAEIIGLTVAVYSALPVAFDHVGFHVMYNAAGQVLMVVAASWLIPTYGILGAGLATIIPHVIGFVAVGTYLALWRRLPVPTPNLGLAALMLAALVTAGALGLAYREYSLVTLALKAASYLGIVLVVFSRLTGSERGRLSSARAALATVLSIRR